MTMAIELEGVLAELKVVTGEATTEYCSKLLLGETEAVRRKINAIAAAAEQASKPSVPADKVLTQQF